MAYVDPNPPRYYYRTRDGEFCGYVLNSTDTHVALKLRDGASWFPRADLVPVPMAEAVNLW